MAAARTSREEPTRAEALVEQAGIYLRFGEHTTDSLARALDVSVATTARLVQRLRKALAARGSELVSVRRGRRWRYEVREEERLARLWETDAFVKAIGAIRGGKRTASQDIDDVVYNGV